MPAEKFWYVMGDIHDSPDNVEKLPNLADCSGLIISGDLTNCGDAAAAKKILERFLAKMPAVLAQVGNMDLQDVNQMLEKQKVNLHAQLRELTPEIALMGIGGSTPTPMNTPTEFSEKEYAFWLEKEWEQAAPYQHKVLISHNPPKDTICDDVGNNIHVGSTAVRKFIEKYQPEICICGHIHEGKGIDFIGNTKVLNPGQFSEGGYVKLTLNGGKLDATLEKISKL